MSELIGYLVARSGAEQAAARMAVCISQQLRCEDDRVDRAHARIDAESIGTAARDFSRYGAASGSPISIVDVRENIAGHAIGQIAGAIPSFGLFD